MKNGLINISAFGFLDDIAKNHTVKARVWAKAAWQDERYASRISELRKLLEQSKSGIIDEKVGRVLSADKLYALLSGLKSILGGDTVKKELKDKLSKVKTEREKNLILIMAAEDDDQKSIRLFLETLIDKRK